MINPGVKHSMKESFIECYRLTVCKWTAAVRLYISEHPGEAYKNTNERFIRWRAEDDEFRAALEQVRMDIVEEVQEFMFNAVRDKTFPPETRVNAAKYLLDRLGKNIGYSPEALNVGALIGNATFNILPASQARPQGENIGEISICQ